MTVLRTLLGSAPLWLALALPVALVAQPASTPQATQQPAYQPITTGSPTEKMDAGEPDKAMEGYRHSSTVQALSRVLHVPVERGAQIFEDLNSAVLVLVLLFFLVKYLPAAFKGRRERIGRDLADARSATELARERLHVVEARLAGLDKEIEAIREQAARDSERDQKRIEASLKAERERIVRSAEQEIRTAEAAAQRELKRFAADLAVGRAMERIQLSEEQDRALVHEFTDGLAGSLGRERDQRGQN